MTGTRPDWTVAGLAVLGDHKLRLLFDDGTVGDIDFSNHEWPGVLAVLRDPSYFATAVVAHGTLYWPEHDLDLAPEPLYQEALKHPVTEASAKGSGPRAPVSSTV